MARAARDNSGPHVEGSRVDECDAVRSMQRDYNEVGPEILRHPLGPAADR
jgi:hypothetical protein